MNAHSRSAVALRRKFVSLFASDLRNRVNYTKQTLLFLFIYVGCPTLCTLFLFLNSMGIVSAEFALGFWTGAFGYSALLYMWILRKDAQSVNASLKLIFLRNRGMQRELSATRAYEWTDYDLDALDADAETQKEVPKLKIVR